MGKGGKITEPCIMPMFIKSNTFNVKGEIKIDFDIPNKGSDMNIEEIKKDKQAIEEKFNKLIEDDYLSFVNKYKDHEVNINLEFEELKTMGGEKLLKGKTNIRVEL